ncbi:hypothetical protein GS982_20460 [Rhodococcus hoagii]|nr:hypothetical protein [Prescottella equi]NKZ84568.1 hypothetical protein [Prescottella equi]
MRAPVDSLVRSVAIAARGGDVRVVCVDRYVVRAFGRPPAIEHAVTVCDGDGNPIGSHVRRCPAELDALEYARAVWRELRATADGRPWFRA